MLRVAFRYNDPRPFARAVCWFRGGDSAHCEVSFQVESGQHTCVSASFLDGGVRCKTMPLPPEKWRVYELDVEDLRAWAWFSANAGANYDILGLLGFIWRPVKGSAHRWFCSEAAAAIIGLENPEAYDLILLESVCKRFGRKVQ